MSEPAAVAGHEETVHGSGRAHPSDGRYVLIALVLGVLTALEIVTFYVEDTLGAALVPVLMVMMVVKFVLVAMFFMHLRFDSSLLTRLFVSGIFLAVSVYVAFLLTFQFFVDG